MWTIKYFSESVRKDIEALPIGLRTRYFRYARFMKEHGANIGGTHTKHIKNGLFELRLRSKEGIARAMYCSMIKNEIVILHCFIKKTQKTPKKELDIALKRLKEVKKYDNS